jgi:hypothetical protein
VLEVAGVPTPEVEGVAAALRDANGTSTRVTLVRGLEKVALALDLRSAVTGARRRLAVAERDLGRPWEGAEGSDWTWATVTVQIIASASRQSVESVEQERQRIAE